METNERKELEEKMEERSEFQEHLFQEDLKNAGQILYQELLKESEKLALGTGNTLTTKEKRRVVDHLMKVSRYGLVEHMDGYFDLLYSLLTEGKDYKKKVNFDYADSFGNTPLHHAVMANQREAVEFLLEHGANIEATAHYEKTPLYYAVEDYNFEMVKLLVEKGANVNTKKIGDPIYSDFSLLHEAVKREVYRSKGEKISPIVEFLVSKGADVNAKNGRGKTPLDIAEAYEDEEVIKILKKYIE